MRKGSIRSSAAALLLLGGVQLHAQTFTPLDVMPQDVTPLFGPKTPVLLRADQPTRAANANGATGDPSLAGAFNAVFNGINLNGVAVLQTPDDVNPDLAFFCTAARIGPRTLITAAHCVTDEATGALLPGAANTRALFYFTGSTNTTASFAAATASSIVVAPQFRGFDNPATQVGYDVALVNFDFTLPAALTTYSLFLGDPLFQNTTMVGSGTYGNGDQGGIGFDLRRRVGNNRVDFFTLNPASDDFNILYGDFDDGTAAHDAFCFVSTVLCNTGRGATEASLGGGDSGGPLFINGQLAAVNSFTTFLCTPRGGTCVPNSPPLKNPAVVDGFGAISGYAGVAGNYGFISTVLGIPEPSTFALAGGGLLLTAIGARRRATRRP